MKNLITILLIAIGINLSEAQVKSTGIVTIPGALKPMSIKLDMYKGQNLLVMTVTGPADRLFNFGFDGNSMGGTAGKGPSDSVTITKENAYLQVANEPYRAPGANALLDTKGFTGHQSIAVDAGDNDWKVISDDGDLSNPSKTVRTVVATRPLNTGDTTGEDYQFNFDNLTTLPIIWAMWNNAQITGTDDGMWSLAGRTSTNLSSRHQSGNAAQRGTLILTFAPPTGKSTGVVTLTPVGAPRPMTLKLDLDNANERVYMTVTGPADRMFQIGFNGTTMASVSDAVAITKLGACDQLAGGTAAAPVPYIAPAGNAFLDTNGFNGAAGSHRATVKDAVNDWIVLSDDGDYPPTKATRTVLAFRALNTNSTSEGDYQFEYNNLTTLNVIWAQGKDVAPPTAEAPDDGYWALSGRNTIGGSTRHGSGVANERGATALSFANLGIADNAYSEKITIYPNPIKNTVNVLANSSTSISTVRIFDINAKLLKEIHPETTNDFTIDISNLKRGIYFMEISNDRDKTVKKIIKE